MSMKELADSVAAEIRIEMAEALESPEDIPWWDECRCACEGGTIGCGTLHRRYTRYCVGHDADVCPAGGIYYRGIDDEPGGWEHGPHCATAYTRRPDLDNLSGAAWKDGFSGHISHHDPRYDPNSMNFRRRKC